MDAAEVEGEHVGLPGVVLGDVDVAALELIDVGLTRPVLHAVVEHLVEPRPQLEREREQRPGRVTREIDIASPSTAPIESNMKSPYENS